MKKPLKIGTQLIVDSALLFLFVVMLSIVSVVQSNILHQQTEIMYEHPLVVTDALGALNEGILTMRLGLRDLMLHATDQEAQDALQIIAQGKAEAEQQFDIIRQQYLGPQEDVAAAYQAFVAWDTAREQNIQLALADQIEAAKANMLPGGGDGGLSGGYAVQNTDD